ncbi:hypothetical protein HA466_0046560 [Hirschfeldia incana]|nr:hypothetical protein HA466_0046560 [Hirschfeldia incana]
MSRQTYVDEHLMCDLGDEQRLTAAAILGQDGSVWVCGLRAQISLRLRKSKASTKISLNLEHLQSCTDGIVHQWRKVHGNPRKAKRCDSWKEGELVVLPSRRPLWL